MRRPVGRPATPFGCPATPSLLSHCTRPPWLQQTTTPQSQPSLPPPLGRCPVVVRLARCCRCRRRRWRLGRLRRRVLSAIHPSIHRNVWHVWGLPVATCLRPVLRRSPVRRRRRVVDAIIIRCCSTRRCTRQACGTCGKPQRHGRRLHPRGAEGGPRGSQRWRRQLLTPWHRRVAVLLLAQLQRSRLAGGATPPAVQPVRAACSRSHDAQQHRQPQGLALGGRSCSGCRCLCLCCVPPPLRLQPRRPHRPTRWAPLAPHRCAALCRRPGQPRARAAVATAAEAVPAAAQAAASPAAAARPCPVPCSPLPPHPGAAVSRFRARVASAALRALAPALVQLPS